MIKRFENFEENWEENPGYSKKDRFNTIVDDGDDLRIEDGGCAVIVTTDGYTHEGNEDRGVSLTFTSWDEEMEHPWFEEQYRLFKEKIKE